MEHIVKDKMGIKRPLGRHSTKYAATEKDIFEPEKHTKEFHNTGFALNVGKGLIRGSTEKAIVRKTKIEQGKEI